MTETQAWQAGFFGTPRYAQAARMSEDPVIREAYSRGLAAHSGPKDWDYVLDGIEDSDWTEERHNKHLKNSPDVGTDDDPEYEAWMEEKYGTLNPY